MANQLKKPGPATSIGVTIASEQFRNTMDSFWFFLHPDSVVNTFDFVTVDHIYETKTIGIVKELQAISLESPELYGYVVEEKTKQRESAGVVAAKVAILSNTGIDGGMGKTKRLSVNMPVGVGKPVRFANSEQVLLALGIPEMGNPIPAGVIEMTNGLQVPLSLDISYLLGPDTAHVNATGISGNLKTSYLLFLLQAAYQKLGKYGDKEIETDVAIIIFNTKEGDLLQIDEKKHKIKKKSRELFDLLDLDIEPFSNVTYFLPRGANGKPNSSHIPEKSKTYSYLLEDAYDRLDLLFSEIYSSSLNIPSIVNFIHESWPFKTGSGKAVENWSDLSKFTDYPPEIVANKYALNYFIGHLQQFRKHPLFPDSRTTSTYLGKEIMGIKSGDVFVVDIAMIPTIQHQAFVVGDVMKSIDEMYSERTPTDKSQRKNGKRPRYILIFIDEINRFLPHSQALSNIPAVAEQTMRTILAGRSRGTILFSAQQFKSAVNDVLHENTGLHIIAKVGLSELATKPYNMLDEITKLSIARLNRGELVLVHSAFRHPVRISFPVAAIEKP